MWPSRDENITAVCNKGWHEATLNVAAADDDDNNDETMSLPFSNATNDVSSEWPAITRRLARRRSDSLKSCD